MTITITKTYDEIYNILSYFDLVFTKEEPSVLEKQDHN